jgi:hypothetical protein
MQNRQQELAAGLTFSVFFQRAAVIKSSAVGCLRSSRLGSNALTNSSLDINPSAF